jgi:hypothetical protein
LGRVFNRRSTLVDADWRGNWRMFFRAPQGSSLLSGQNPIFQQYLRASAFIRG